MKKIIDMIIGKEEPTLKALIIYPTRKMSLIKIPAEKETFSVEGTNKAYRVDPDCIYYFKGFNVLIYLANVPQPIRFEENKIFCEYNAQEFKALLENKAITELLTANDEKQVDIMMIIIIGVVLLFGVIAFFYMRGGF
jgi:hypothetical protein